MPEFRLEVNGVERNVALPTLSVQHVVNGPDILEGDVQDDDGSIALILDQVVTLWQTDVSPETVYFEGLLQSKGNNTWTGHGYARLRKITAFDYSVYTTFVDAASETDGTESMATVLQRLVDDHLVDYGVTLHPSQLTGPTLAANAFAGTKANVILNSFSEQTGWVWKIDDQKRLRMWNPATEAAGFNVTATNDTYVHDIATNQLKQRSYNRVFVEGGEGYHTFVNEQHFGDGSASSFPTNAPMHYFESDYTSTLGFMVGLQLFVVRTGATTIEYANDQGTAQWKVTNYDGSTGAFRDNPSLTQVSGATLGPTEYILFTYAGKYPFRIVADGRGSPPVPPRDLTLYRPLIFNREALQAIADEVLAASIGDFERITYPTRRTDIRPGQTQTVNVPEAGVNGSYTATDVRMRYEPGGDTSEFWLDVTAVNAVTARSFWLNLLDRWLTDNQGGASAASTNSVGSTVIPVGPGLPLYSAQYNKNGTFGGAAGTEGTVLIHPNGEGPDVGVPDTSSPLDVIVNDTDGIAQSWRNLNNPDSQALTLQVQTGGDALFELDDATLSMSAFGASGRIDIGGTTVIIAPNSVQFGDYDGRLAHFWRHDAQAHRRIRVTGTTYTIDNEAAGGGGVYSAWIFDPTAACTVTLPSVSAFMGLPSSGYGRVLEIRNDSALYVVTLDGASSETIFRGSTGRLTFPLMPGASIKLIALDSTGAGWKVLAYDLPPMEVALTDAQLKAWPTGAIAAVPAPGAGFRVHFLGGYISVDTTAGNYANVHANATLVGTINGLEWTSYLVNGNSTGLTQTTYLFSSGTEAMWRLQPYALGGGNFGTAFTDDWGLNAGVLDAQAMDNQPLIFTLNNSGAGALTGGHASNSGKLLIHYTPEPIV